MTKTVALSDEAYGELARLKKPGQSFSQVVHELASRQRPSIRDVAGVLQADSAYWKSFADERRRARRVTRGRVAFEGK